MREGAPSNGCPYRDRRAFITLLGGAAATWPLAARAQQSDQRRRIGVLTALAEDDPETKARLAAFRQGLEKRGWSEGRNVRIDYRFAPDSAQVQVLAKGLVALQPDVILAHRRRPSPRCSGRAARFRSCSLSWPTRSARASLRACRGQAAISLVSCSTKRALPASGSRCSRRSRPGLCAPPSWPTPRRPPFIIPTYRRPKPRRRRLGLSLYPPSSRTPATLSVPSRPSAARRTVAWCGCPTSRPRSIV